MTKPTDAHIRDRIVELRRVRAGDLRANPKNWRRHPTEQRRALRAMLADVGFAGAALAYEADADGQLTLIDGHLRADLEADVEIPVLVLDVDDAEADKLLATFDPLAAMAIAEDEAFAQLLADVVLPEAVAFEELAAETKEQVSFQASKGKEHRCPDCGHEWLGKCKPDDG